MHKIDNDELNKQLELLKSRQIILVEPFKNTSEKHLYRCLVCNHEWRSQFYPMINRMKGCFNCYINKRLEELKERGIEMLDPYIRSDSKYNFRCLTCGHVWSTTFSSVYNVASGCYECALKARRTNKTKRVVKKRQPTSNHAKAEAKREKLKTRLNELLDRHILLKEDFKGATERHIFECTLCGYLWETSFSNVYNAGTGCRQCGYKKREELKASLNKAEITDRLVLLAYRRDIEPLGDFQGIDKKHWFKCLKCKHEWQVPMERILYRNGSCPECKKRPED
jgi:predicted  nucleic acid-binding Zn-ribbon protein